MWTVDLQVTKMACRTPRDPACMQSSRPKPKSCWRCASSSRSSSSMDRATRHICNKDSCRWPYISSADRVMILQSCANERMNGSCGYSIAISFKYRELGRPAWKQNQLFMRSVNQSIEGQMEEGICTFRSTKGTRRSLVALQCSPGFGRHHEEHPCASPLTRLCVKQNPNARMLSWDDLAHFGNWRINLVRSVCTL